MSPLGSVSAMSSKPKAQVKSAKIREEIPRPFRGKTPYESISLAL